MFLLYCFFAFVVGFVLKRYVIDGWSVRLGKPVKGISKTVKPTLHNVQEMATLFPHKFKAPPAALLDYLSEGSLVQLGMGDDRFYVEILERKGPNLFGVVHTLYHRLDWKHVKIGQKIKFTVDNVYKVHLLPLEPQQISASETKVIPMKKEALPKADDSAKKNEG